MVEGLKEVNWDNDKKEGPSNENLLSDYLNGSKNDSFKVADSSGAFKLPDLNEVLGITGSKNASEGRRANPWADKASERSLEQGPKKAGSPDDYSNTSKAAISTVIAAAALKKGESVVENGKPLQFINNFDLEQKTGDGRDAERAYWVKKTADAVPTLDHLPKNAKLEASAEVSGNDIVLRGSILVKGDWPKEDQAKKHSMKVKDENGNYIKDESGDDKTFPSIHKLGFVHDNAVPGKPVIEIVRDKQNGLRSFAIPHPGEELPGYKLEEYAQGVVDKVWQQDGKSGFVEFPMYEKVEEGNVSGIEGLVWKGGGHISEYKYKFVDGANEKGYLSYEEQKITITRSIARPPEPPPATQMDQRMLIVHVAQDGRIFRTIDIKPEHMKRADIDRLMKETEKKIN